MTIISGEKTSGAQEKAIPPILTLLLYYIQESCPSIKNILLLDSEGKRVAVKYYSDDWPTNSAKEAFEKAVFTKTQKTNARTEGCYFFMYQSLTVFSFSLCP